MSQRDMSSDDKVPCRDGVLASVAPKPSNAAKNESLKPAVRLSTRYNFTMTPNQVVPPEPEPRRRVALQLAPDEGAPRGAVKIIPRHSQENLTRREQEAATSSLVTQATAQRARHHMSPDNRRQSSHNRSDDDDDDDDNDDVVVVVTPAATGATHGGRSNAAGQDELLTTAAEIREARDKIIELTKSPSDCYIVHEHELVEELDYDEDCDVQPPDELADLSRQSMMPLRDILAYYQYIQQDNEDCIVRDHHGAGPGPAPGLDQQQQQQQLASSHSHNPRDVPDSDVARQHDHSKTFSENDSAPQRVSSQAPVVKSEAAADGQPLAPQPVDTGESLAQAPKEADARLAQPPPQPPPVAPLKDKRKIRANVVLELINSERDFVKHLRDVVEGYLYPARRHPEIFTRERINTIFSNIEQLYAFQRKFLEDIERCIDWSDLAASEVGQCFLDHEKGFEVYHYYCNNHPNALSELQDLYTKPTFVKFFEACRLLQNMIDISLDGFLLTPIQKICKYPLQLNELFKNTAENHPDFSFVAQALETMRNCANLANERKRRIEALADVMSFQAKVENWFGPKLSDTSSMLIHSGEVSKMNHHSWSQGIQLYLFDHLLLLCKRDLLKRTALILKQRISMDTVTEIADADEYKPRKSFKLYCGEQQRWFVFTTRSERERDEWIRSFERERNLIEADENEGFSITDREISIARRALLIRKHNRSARYRHKRPDTAIVDQLDLDDANTIMNRTLSLPSSIHPSHVMNFVEESKVISSPASAVNANSTGRKKSGASPTASAHLATNSSGFGLQHLDCETGDSSQQSAGSWFRKMGSKKLTKSQMYALNGSTNALATATPTLLAAASSTSNLAVPAHSAIDQPPPAPTTNYDQLEKRHRDHMVIEEQARLYRLNNDLPISAPLVRFGSKTTVGLPSGAGAGAGDSRRPAPVGRLAAPKQAPGVEQSVSAPPPATGAPSAATLSGGLRTLELTSDCAAGAASDARLRSHAQQPQPQPQHPHHQLQPQPQHQQTAPKHDSLNPVRASFETTMVLSSGKVVRVREDAV